MEPATIGLAAAFTAGLLSFLSPCVLPLIPSYASFITGLSLAELTDDRVPRARVRRSLLVHGGLFVLGFSTVWITLGATATLLGSALNAFGPWLERIGGVLLILFGLSLLGLIRIPGTEREWRFHLAQKPAGYLGTLLVGLTFAAGWTPCIGFVLGPILGLASTMETASRGALLLGVYSAGLAVPFLFTTLALDRFLAGFRRFHRWLPWVSRFSGLLLVIVGVLLVTGSFTVLAALLARWTPMFLLERI